MIVALRRLAPFVIAALLLIALPYALSSRTALTLLCAIGINAVFALSYNVLLGQSGMLSFGHAAFFGFGAYAAIHFMAAISAHVVPLPTFVTPLVGFAAGAIGGALIGLPVCRRSGTPFAMITLGIGELFAAAAFMLPGLFGGEEGITGNRASGPHPFGFSLGPNIDVYWFTAFWTFVAATLMYAFTRTPMGRLANAVRDNPDRLQFIGYDPHRVRYFVYVLSGAMAGLAGGMSAVNYEIVTPSVFNAVNSGSVLIMAYVGGAGLFLGPIAGAILLTFMQSMLADYSEASLFYVGIIFLAVVLAAPGGIAGLALSLWRGAREHGARRIAPFWAARGVSLAAIAIGVVIVVEMAFRLQDSDAGPLHLFGATLQPENPVAWGAGIALVAAGLGAARASARFAPKDAVPQDLAAKRSASPA
jgi:branched-chain amino acid transport system permease protein